MSQISQLELEIQGCQENIRNLQAKRGQLEEAKRQNGMVANETGTYIMNRRSYAGNIHQYNGRTTISKRIAEKIEANYSRTEEINLLNNYDAIDSELKKEIQKIDDEIEAQNEAIRDKQRRIEAIREEERREQERREREQREREQREREENERRRRGTIR
ncbi:hypothetical protein [Roseburia sp. MSJ-14]|uniref:hypothetical protein n=1 Tax=Roseburia sp. MSJ-14 TaxID=2841514 RepID=UPI001C1029BC|nr:hypothetical protein [Roseburia sp. MSJ-14]MBU5472033.1 hypothetical protein [Roseburia sp. MSJ-14]